MSKSNNKVYIPLSDTNIVNLAVREDFFPGNCDTCEYGQKYVQDVRFEAEDDRSDQAERWGRTAIKVVEKGVPTYANASADQLREIPRLTQSMNYQSSIVRDTYQYVQKGLDLSDYNLQQSLGELEYTDALEQ